MFSARQLSVIEGVVNRVLAGDPDTPARLSRLAGRTVRVDSWLARDVSLYVTFDENLVHLDDTFDGEVDATISGGPLGFARAAADPANRDVFGDGTLSVSGDAMVVQAAAELFGRYRYDWQGRVEPVIGEAATARLESLLDRLEAWRGEVRAKVAADAGEYLREEKRLLATRESVASFGDAVDNLVSDVSRLQKRIELLEKRRG